MRNETVGRGRDIQSPGWKGDILKNKIRIDLAGRDSDDGAKEGMRRS